MSSGSKSFGGATVSPMGGSMGDKRDGVTVSRRDATHLSWVPRTGILDVAECPKLLPYGVRDTNRRSSVDSHGAVSRLRAAARGSHTRSQAVNLVP